MDDPVPLRRLFPSEYANSAIPVEPEMQFMSLWGQFLDRRWELRTAAADAFLRTIDAASTLDGLHDRFPLNVLAPRSDINAFYRFLGIFP